MKANVEKLVDFLVNTLKINVRKGSVGCRFDHDKKRWEVSAVVQSKDGMKVGKLADFDDVNDAVTFERLMNY